MLFSDLAAAGITPQLAMEAIRLMGEVVHNLHAVAAHKGGVLFALPASVQLADDLSAFGAVHEDAEEDGTAEPDARGLPKALAALLAAAPRDGHPVPPWSPPEAAPAAPEPVLDIYRHWPELAPARAA